MLINKKMISELFAIIFIAWLGSIPWSFASSMSEHTATVKFASEATYPPFVTLDSKGNIGGFETEVVKNICKKANINCEFHHKPFDSLFPSLQFKKIDAVYGCVGITEARKKQVLFSKPLYTVLVGFIFKNNFLDIDVVGIQKGTAGFESYLKKQYPNVKLKTYASIQDALLDLKNNRIKAVFGDIPVFKHWEKSMGAMGYQYLALTKEEVHGFSEGNGFAVRNEDQELMEKINSAYDDIVRDGTLQKLEKQYLE